MALLAVQAGQFHAIFVLGNVDAAPVPIKEAIGEMSASVVALPPSGAQGRAIICTTFDDTS
jgi:hypothetical protein